MGTILAEAIALGHKAKGYRFGDEGPDYYDCSGLMYAASKAAGVYSGGRFTTATVGDNKQFGHVASPRVDDLVVWSENAAHGHMGVISAPDKFYSARSVADGLGYLTISTFHVYPVKPFYLRPVKSDGYIPPVRDLKLGMVGSDVKVVQKIVGVTVDGAYGPHTEAAVVAWQKAHHLTPDGVVGPNTRAAMGIH